jgi:hypothetical protein
LSIAVSNGGTTTLPLGWTVVLEGGYTAVQSSWNMACAVADGKATCTSNGGTWQDLQPAFGNTMVVGGIMSGQFAACLVPASATLNGVLCQLTVTRL